MCSFDKEERFPPPVNIPTTAFPSTVFLSLFARYMRLY